MVECTHLNHFKQPSLFGSPAPQDERIHQSTTILLIAYYTQHTVRSCEIQKVLKNVFIPGVHWHIYCSLNLPVNLKLFLLK